MIKNIKYNQCMKNYCTMHVGGNAKYFVEVDSLCELKNTVKECNKKSIKYFILGNGSNVIFTDKGYNGCVISTKKLNKITVKNNIVCAECGVNLFRLNQELIEHGLSGIEWSYGIPGTIGGAVCMNAGAYGGEMKDVVLKVKVFDGKTTKILYTNELEMGYRNSIIKQTNLIVLKVWLKLKKDSKIEIQKRCKNFFKTRKETQPLNYYNSGSIFKKTKGIIAGKTIDNLGLKSVKINGAQISNLHANFIINKENAKCEDILGLIELVKQKVKFATGVELEEEIIVVGER